MKFNFKKYIISVLSVIFLIFIDQITKYMAVINLKDKDPFIIIKGVFELFYLENRGAAFGVMQDKKTIFVIMTLIILIGIVYIFIKMPDNKKYRLMNIIAVFLCAGAVGNLIDRIVNNYVVDFFYFKLINFPVFNVADCYVVCSLLVLLISFIFYYKEEDLNFIFLKHKKEN